MFCSSCGGQLTSDSAFCPNCGANNQTASNRPILNGTIETPGVKSTSFFKTNNGRLVALAAGLAVVVGSFFLLSGGGGPNLSAALSNCGLSEADEGVALGDGGNSLYLDGQGEEEYSGVSSMDQWCVLEELNVPEIVVTQIENTNSLQGVQDADWDGLKAEWTYHPDNGLELSITKN